MIYDAFGFSNYPKMWFYLLLRLCLLTLSLWIGKIYILFLCSFQGTLVTCPQTSVSG